MQHDVLPAREHKRGAVGRAILVMGLKERVDRGLKASIERVSKVEPDHLVGVIGEQPKSPLWVGLIVVIEPGRERYFARLAPLRSMKIPGAIHLAKAPTHGVHQRRAIGKQQDLCSRSRVGHVLIMKLCAITTSADAYHEDPGGIAQVCGERLQDLRVHLQLLLALDGRREEVVQKGELRRRDVAMTAYGVVPVCTQKAT